jgi:hypothetical protein
MACKAWIASLIFLASSFFVLPARADQSNSPGVPGTVNYLEGQVSLASQPLNSKSIGSAVLQPGQSLDTGSGKVELLLVPGVFFRLGSNSSAEMISAGLVETELQLNQGTAIVEVDEIHPENHLLIHEKGITVRLEKTGLYSFDLNDVPLRVLDGKASVDTGARRLEVKGGHELIAADNGAFSVQKFDRKSVEDADLYSWSSLRSAYLAEANVNEASYYDEMGGLPGGPFWWGAGWYWDPWFDAYTFLPGDGIFFSPFGWGFYSPWCVRMSPYYGSTFWYGHRVAYYHFAANPAQWGTGTRFLTASNYNHGIYTGPGSTHSPFHSGPRFTAAGFGSRTSGIRGLNTTGAYRGGGFLHSGGFHSGGFHGGGFHGGGFGGGFHGGGMSIGGHGR